MKQLIVLLILFYSYFICGQQNVDSSIILTCDRSSASFSLPSNPTTGYSWVIQSYDANLIYIKHHRFEPSNSGLIGAGGREVWTIEATAQALKTAPHQTMLRMIYARPWELKRGKMPFMTRQIIIQIR